MALVPIKHYLKLLYYLILINVFLVTVLKLLRNKSFKKIHGYRIPYILL